MATAGQFGSKDKASAGCAPAPICDSVSRRGQYVNGQQQGGSLARRRYQKGQLLLIGNTWYGRWREDVLEGEVRKRIRHKEPIGSLKDYPSKRLAQRALDDRIAHVNKISYRPMPTAKFADFAQNWKVKVLSQFGDSTAINYRTHIRKHLVPFFGEYPIKDIPALRRARKLPEIFASHFRACGPRQKRGAMSLTISWKALYSQT
jgi:Phage integrase, N-terminal SAM-like domain